MVATHATAATNGERNVPAKEEAREPAKPYRLLSLNERLQLKLDAAKRHRSVIRFFENHRWLLTAKRHRIIARAALWRANRGLARVTRNITWLRRVLRRQEARRRASWSPKVAICQVFGRRYCGEALSVAWCESRHSTLAQNGQYLGLFQMGSWERQLFGHGSTAFAQASAAHRYFVLTGRDWSPWGCKPGYA